MIEGVGPYTACSCVIHLSAAQISITSVKEDNNWKYASVKRWYLQGPTNCSFYESFQQTKDLLASSSSSWAHLRPGTLCTINSWETLWHHNDFLNWNWRKQMRITVDKSSDYWNYKNTIDNEENTEKEIVVTIIPAHNITMVKRSAIAQVFHVRYLEGFFHTKTTEPSFFNLPTNNIAFVFTGFLLLQKNWDTLYSHKLVSFTASLRQKTLIFIIIHS